MSISLALLAMLAAAPDDTPQLPPIVVPDIARSGDCASAADRQAILSALQAFIRDTRPAVQRANSLIGERLLARQRNWIQRGVWTQDQARRFAVAVTQRADYRIYSDQTAAMARDLAADLQTIQGTSDPVVTCRVLQHIAGIVEQAPGIANRGWRAIDAAFDEEAARRGVAAD